MQGQDTAVGKAAHQRLAHLAHVCAALGAQDQGLGHGTDGGADDHLVGHFGKLSAAGRAHMRGSAERGKHGQGSSEIGRAASCHDGKRSLFGAHGAAGNWCIQSAKTLCFQLLRVCTRLGWRNAGHVDPQCAGAHGCRHALIEQHLMHHGAVFEHADDPIGLCSGFGGRGVAEGTVLLQAFRLAGGAVPDVDGKACLAQATSHGKTHGASAQQGKHGAFGKRIGHQWKSGRRAGRRMRQS